MKAIIGKDNLYLDAIPTIDHLLPASANSSPSNSESVCRHILDFQQELVHETDHFDHLLFRLQQYYNSTKTKRQLQLELPAGFRRTSEFQKLRYYIFATNKLRTRIMMFL
jgi:hypothetical protein